MAFASSSRVEEFPQELSILSSSSVQTTERYLGTKEGAVGIISAVLQEGIRVRAGSLRIIFQDAMLHSVENPHSRGLPGVKQRQK